MFLRRLTILLARGLPVVCALGVHAQSHWTQEQYTGDGQGSPGAVYALGFNQQGRLFIGSERGLFISDGNGIRQPHHMPLPGNAPVHGLATLADGSFLIGAQGHGVMRMDAQGRHMQEISTTCTSPRLAFRGERLAPEVIRAVLCEPAATQAARSAEMVVLNSGLTAVNTGKDLLLFQQGQLAHLAPFPMGHSSGLAILGGTLYTFSDGELYAITQDGSSIRQVTTAWPSYAPERDVRAGGLFWHAGSDTAVVERGGRLLAVSSSGSRELLVQDLGIRTPRDARVNDVLWRPGIGLLAVGTDQGLWIHHQAVMRGISCPFPDQQRSTFVFPQVELGDGEVLTMARDRMARSVVFKDGECLPSPDGLEWFNSAGVAKDGKGRILFGRDQRLFRHDPATGRQEVLSEKGGSPPIFLVDADTIWVAAHVGIGKIVGEEMHWLDKDLNAVLGGRPYALARDSIGRLWIGGPGHIYLVDPESGTLTPLPDSAIPYSMAMVPAGGMMFIPTYGHGIFVHDEHGRTRSLPMDPHTYLKHALAIMVDELGWWWISTNNGMVRVRGEDVLGWTNDPTSPIHYAYYTDRSMSDKRHMEFNGGCSPPFIRLRNGMASFPTSSGLVQFMPESVSSPWPHYPIVLDHVVASGTPVMDTGLVRLSPNNASLEVGFSVAHWGEPSNVRLEYALSGSNEWTPIPLEERVLRLHDLPFGRHELTIRKAVGGHEHPLVLSFIMPRPFYYRAWFILLAVSAGAGLVLLFARLHTARLRGRNLVLERRVRARTNELVLANQELQRSLRSKELLVSILSHDVVTPLRFVAHVANDAAGTIGGERQGKDPVWPMVRDLAQATDKLQANARELLRWIKHQDSRLKPRWQEMNLNQMAGRALRMIEEQAARQGTSLINSIAEDHMVRTDRNMFSVILANLVQNAIGHTAGGAITVEAVIEGDHHVITVRDTGTGMPAATMEHLRRLRDHGSVAAMQEHGEREVQGLGYIILTDLLRLLNGRFDVESHPNQGTVVTLFLPIAH